MKTIDTMTLKELKLQKKHCNELAIRHDNSDNRAKLVQINNAINKLKGKFYEGDKK